MILVLNDENVQELQLIQLMKQAGEKCLIHEGISPEDEKTEVSVSFVSKEEIREINAEYRSKDTVTDVLSFPQYENLEDFTRRNPGARIHYASTKAPRNHTKAEFRDGDYIMFGKESRGLPESLLAAHYDSCIRIPMVRDARSLNLSNSVAVVLYEALRQLDFPGLQEEGHLTGRVD